MAVDNFIVDAGAIRDLGKLTMAAGNLTEAVTVTADVTPVQVSTGARQASVTADQLTNIQMKGRDIYGLLAVVAGVQDANRAINAFVNPNIDAVAEVQLITAFRFLSGRLQTALVFGVADEIRFPA